jgi:CheY-like chemotaxis protein
LVAHESEALLTDISAVLGNAGFAVVPVRDSGDAMRLMAEKRPAAAVLDVALTTVRAFDLIEQVRASSELTATKIVLVASDYNRNAYKRKPAKLYGADDYVEQHHIIDLLPAKLYDLLGLRSPSVAFPSNHQDPGLDAPVAIPTNAVSAAAGERVRALAHSIVADIALYNHVGFEAALAGAGDPALDSALAEGRRVLATMVADHEWPVADPVREAFDVLIMQMRGGRPA